MNRPIINLDELQFESWEKLFKGMKPPPEGYDARRAGIGRRIGAQKLGYNVMILPPGKRAYPRHSHRVNEEMFLILEGEGELRVGDERWPVRKHDVIACPPGGPETAHQLINTSTSSELRVLSVSTMESPDMIEYPDSGKMSFGGFFPSADGKPQFVRGLMRSGQNVDYWEGE